jgi:hypothetical protein
MKTSALITALGLALVPAIAAAQPGAAQPGAAPVYAPPPAPQAAPGGFHQRAGRFTAGFSIGLGGMSSSNGPIECSNCNYNPLGAAITGHLGFMASPRLAVLFEGQVNGQTLEDYGDGSRMLLQSAAMAAAQYWITPQLWIKGGVGFAHLSYNYEDYYGSFEEPIDDGIATMGAIGYEILSAPRYSIDVQGRFINGSYDGINDNVSSGTIGLGFNWH